MTTWVLLEGHEADVRAEREALGSGWAEVEDGPDVPAGGRRSMRPSEIRELGGDFLAEVGVGTVYVAQTPGRPAPETTTRALHQRLKAAFDPTGRLNPGRTP